MTIASTFEKAVWAGSVVLAATLLARGTASAQSADPAWLRSIDELIDVEVSTAAKRERRLADTAAAAFVLTRDDIRRSGLTNVPSLLRLIPGVQVAQIDGNKWAISVRGFNSRWANKLLVMIDGQSVYSDVFSGVYWDALDVPIDFIERIEVIRGPGGSLWGANAVNGVINIITRAPVATGGAVEATFGEAGQSTGSVRYGASLGSRVQFQAYASGGLQDDTAPDFTTDQWKSIRSGARVSLDVSRRDHVDLHVSGSDDRSWFTGTRVVSSMPLRHEQWPAEADTDTWRASTRWTRTLRDGGTVQGSAGWMTINRDDTIFFLDGSAAEASFQHTAGRSGRHEFTWGAATRHSINRMAGSATFDITADVVEQSQSGVFAQDDIGLADDRVIVTLGTKLERFTHSGWHWQPTARALWHLSTRQSVWGGISRAVRTPSITEREMVVDLFEAPGPMPLIGRLYGNPELRPESLTALEMGYRWTSTIFSVDVAAYHNRYEDAVNLEMHQPYVATTAGVPHLLLPVLFDNKQRVSTAGGEVLLALSPSPRWRVVGTYSLFTVRERLDPDSNNLAVTAFDASTPRHQGTVRSLFALPHRIDVDATAYLVGRIDSDAVPAYARFDTRIGWRMRPSFDVSLLGRNLFDSNHVEFTNVSGGVAFAPARRQLSVTTTWRF
jgi:iron complex outermembrane receptor protein